MTEESGKKRSIVVLHTDPSYDGQHAAYTEDDDAWRAFLENPLTAASKAMMSVNGDDESASALGLLYDYYKVPRDKRAAGQIKTEVLSEDADPNKINFLTPYQDSLQAVTPLRNVPLHSVLQGSVHGREKRGAYPATDSAVSIPVYSGDLEGTLHSFPVGHAGPHSSQSDGMAFSRQLTHSQYSPRAQTLTPDSTYIEPYKDGSTEAFPLPEEIQLRMASINPEAYSPSFSSSASIQPFEYILEAPQSIRPKSATGPMSYLNKGQFYPIILRDVGISKVLPHHRGRVRSVVMLVFGEDKFTDDQLKHWRYWHSRQHTAKQRCLDIADYKESFNTIANIEEIAYNAISFSWDTRNEARIFVSVNCLSTDFSPQKGVRGLPLNLQIDTYVCGSHGDKLIHRASSQIKVFCDKGAERKIRDEERKHTRRKTKGMDAAGAQEKEPMRYLDITMFKVMSDLESQPVLFIPEAQSSNTQRLACLSDEGEDSLGQKRLLYHTEEPFDFAPSKRAKRDEPQKVLLYVRREAEEVFDALMLKTPTLSGLLEAVTEKYALSIEKIGKVYKRCKKGILVNMDDNIIKHYSNEDTFQIHIEEVGGLVRLILTEI